MEERDAIGGDGNSYTAEFWEYALHNLSTTTNTWTPSLLDNFKEDVNYDANGNILSYLRNGSPLFAGKSIQMDNLTYNYIAGTNKLSSVSDATDDGDYGNDIKSQGDENYKYDPIGNLIHDDKAGIDNIEWTVYGKIKGISKTNGVDITYTYDAAGNRISKDVKGQQTWYVRDASGNIMSVYTSKDATVNNGDLTQTETELYGSSRLGMSTLATNVENRPVPVTTNMPGLGEGKNIIFTRGNKLFELSNHLGNVLATVSDEKKPISLNGTTIDYYEAKITSAQDYYPFGMLMPGRNGHHIAGGWSTGSSVVNGYTVPESLTLGSHAGNQPGDYTASQTINFTEGFNSGVNDAFNATIADDSYDGGGSSGTGDGSSVATSGYRYGFNGKENDNEVKGEGNQQDYGMRIYDPRVGRFLSVDPLTKEYPWYTPYQFAGNNPVKYVDLDGGEQGYSYRDNRGVMITVPAGDNLQRRVPPEHLKYLADGSAAGQRNFALEFAVGVGAPVALVLDAGTGFTITRTVLQVSTVATAANMVSHMHESGNAKNPVVKQELEHQAKDEAAELVMQWMAGKFLKTMGQAIKSAPLILSKSSRLKMFYDRLNTAASVDNPKDAIKLINNTLDEVEDAYSGGKKAKGIPDRDDGRMYGILDDKYVTKLDDGTTQAFTKGHKILLKEDGSFTIQERKTGKIVLEKPGK